jgi:hypothetical protein
LNLIKKRFNNLMRKMGREVIGPELKLIL